MKKSELNRHIVIVDDDSSIRRITGSILTDAGMDFTPLESGSSLITYFEEGNTADLILLDILMPEMDGFDTLRALRKLEKKKHEAETPVIFLTGDEDKAMEAKGFSMGAMDFIRKPIDDEILLLRIDNILSRQNQIRLLSERSRTDLLTGLLNKTSTETSLETVCESEPGILLVLDLDNFKPVNDIYGHDAGDKVLTAFANLLKNSFRSQDIIGRFGGDEFIVFLRNADQEKIVLQYVRQLNERFLKEAFRILGNDMNIPLGVSCGAAFTNGDTKFETLFQEADRELLRVKQAGKHGCRIWRDSSSADKPVIRQETNLHELKLILEERNTGKDALWLSQEDFGNIYRYMIRYFRRYHENAYRLLFSVIPEDADMSEDTLHTVMDRFGEILKCTLRNSDIMMKCDSSHFLLLLPNVVPADIDRVTDRISYEWDKDEKSRIVRIQCEKEPVSFDEETDGTSGRADVPWILVVDDSVSTLKMAGTVLSEAGMRVTGINSAKALLDRISNGEKPDLILLDIMMPKMDGFEAMKRLRSLERKGEEIPVIFLTDSEEKESETIGLTLGATDFVKKPIVPEVLRIRVERALIFNRRRR
ncbi:MAG: response regulator [Lachnospiraceae bacterium]|nr:response regulator [Lachnospiraceae bacterium]